MKKYKFGLLSLFLLSGFLMGPSYVSADIFYRVPSVGLGPGVWTSIHFYYSEGDIVIIQWFVPMDSGDTLDVMVLDEENYTLFVDGYSYDTFYVNNNTINGIVTYQNITEGLYFVVFTNDHPSNGMSFGFQFTLVEADSSCDCNCNCNCTYTPSPSPATISGFVTLTFGLVTLIAILILTKKTKFKKL